MRQPPIPPETGKHPIVHEGIDPETPDMRWHCDRCGAVMLEDRCKIVCPNCGSRFDCSDLNLYFD